MTLLKNRSLEDFSGELAAGSAAPGGGSAAAFSGALGAALVSMVCRLTLGKKEYAEYEEELKDVLALSEDLGKKLLNAVDVDAAAYGRVMEAFTLPKQTEEEKAVRKDAIQKAFREACESPRKTSLWCLDVLRLCARVSGKVNVNAASDLGVAANQALAGLEGAAMNVLINLPSIRDEEYTDRLREEVEETEEEGRILKAGVLREVLAYIGGAD
ncbi:MAG: methenyltetrahydrofolate cyclohydrolase [Synergistaceae bacterium]|jgi:formiminotetrahydrofolate cyclodeaminase|nr:methenyltetrahydrofolate cyclohydrolase [Synergistaceae bacterium]